MDGLSWTRPLSVLIVEDDPRAAGGVAELLRQRGYDPAVAATGEEALRLAAARPPDVVLLDLGLPGMSGWDVAARLRRMGFAKRPFLAALSGHGGTEDLRRSAEAGLDVHWLKPADADALLALLGRL